MHNKIKHDGCNRYQSCRNNKDTLEDRFEKSEKHSKRIDKPDMERYTVRYTVRDIGSQKIIPPTHLLIPEGPRKNLKFCRVPIDPRSITFKDMEDLFLCCGIPSENLKNELHVKEIKGTDLEYITEGMMLGKASRVEGESSFSIVPRWTYRQDHSNKEIYNLVLSLRPCLGSVHERDRAQ